MASQSPAVLAEKIALREVIKARRLAMQPEVRQRGSDLVRQRVLAHIAGLSAGSPAAKPVVSAFFSIGDELDTRPLLHALHEAGYPLCLPVMQKKPLPLLFRAWAPGDAMATRVWGILEPEPSQPERVPDILLMPLLAFDAHGFRLGYGGGFYDRTLQALRAQKAIVTIGLAFDEQKVDAVPHLDYDERIDWVVTPSGVMRVQS